MNIVPEVRMSSKGKVLASLALLALCAAIFQNFDRVPGIKRIVELPLGLKDDGLKLPANEILDPSMIEVGNLLFFDKRLSKGGVMACATCHDPAKGYAASGRVSGVGGNLLPRTSMPATNRAFASEATWRGERSLEGQSTA